MESVSADIDIGVAASVGNTGTNTIDYDLSQAISNRFYSDASHSLWPLYENQEFIREKHIDLESYERQNMVAMLKERNLLTTVTRAMSFCTRPVLELYSNLTAEVGQPDSIKYGRVFVRNRIYNFTPSIVNNYLHIGDVPEVEVGAITLMRLLL